MDDVRMRGDSALDAVARRVGAWPEVTSHPHVFGGVEFRVGRRAIGHLHGLGDRECVADLPFTRAEHDALIAEGRAREHHVVPGSGWVSAPVRTGEEVRSAITLFAMTYARAMEARMPPAATLVATRVPTRDLTDSPGDGGT